MTNEEIKSADNEYFVAAVCKLKCDLGDNNNTAGSLVA